MVRRCPWCGEKVKKSTSSIKSYRCPYCNKKSVCKTDSWTYWLPALCTFVLYIFFKSYIIIGIGSMIVFSSYIDNIITPLERESKKFIPVKKAKAIINLNQKQNIIQQKINFDDDMIYPICFVNKENIPISHVVCVSIECSKFIKANSFECTLVFLPECQKNVDFYKDTSFYIFDNKQKIGKGKILENVVYPEFKYPEQSG